MSISTINADAFIFRYRKVDEFGGINDKDGFPTSMNASGEAAMPFRSSENRAMAIIVGTPAYRDFKTVPIELSEFVDSGFRA